MILSKAQQFQRLAQLLARIQEMIQARGGDPAVAREKLKDVAERVGVDLEVVRLLDPDTVAAILSPGGAGKVWSVAEVLYLEGILALAEGRDAASREAEAVDRLQRARRLYQHVEPGLDLPEGTPSPEERLREIASLLP